MLMDRYRIVARHNVRRTSADPLEPLTVGNGEFAFTADVTGLQTFPSFHADGMRLGTQAQWAWHTAPNPESYALEESFEDHSTAAGRSVPYSTTGPDFGDPSATPVPSWPASGCGRTRTGSTSAGSGSCARTDSRCGCRSWRDQPAAGPVAWPDREPVRAGRNPGRGDDGL